MLAATLRALLDLRRSKDTLLDTRGNSSSESKVCLSDRRSSNFFIVDSRVSDLSDLHEEEGEEGELLRSEWYSEEEEVKISLGE